MIPGWMLLLAGVALIACGFVAASLARSEIGCGMFYVGAVLLVLAAMVALFAPARGRDLGQWDAADPAVTGATDQAVRAWYRKLTMPDAPTVSCCGEADAYWADTFEEEGGKYVAVITDDRDDGPLHRPHRPVGQRVVIPNHKIKFNEGNPTGHGVLFIGANGGIYCYVPPGGV